MKNSGTRLVWIAVLLLAASFLLLQSEFSLSQQKSIVARVWEGRVALARADEYSNYLRDTGMPMLTGTPGNLGVEILRRDTKDAAEFTVISYWTSREVIKKFAGENIELAHAMPRDPEFLLETVKTVRHYDVVYTDLGKVGKM